MILNGKEIGNFNEPIFIAEIGQNHNGSIETAQKMIAKAKEIGCDYAKFQCWDKDSLFIESFYKNKPGDDFLKTQSLEETLDLLSLSKNDLLEIVEGCKDNNIGFISTPVSTKYVDQLLKIDIDFFKIASFDLNNLPFLKYTASTGKPIVLSTGLSTIQEIEEAINTIYSTGNQEVVLLHCAAAYPPQDDNLHLNNIDLLRDYFGLPVGFSDHSVGFSVSLAAIAKGACMIEKHFTIDNSVSSGDHPISANIEEMEIIVKEGKRIHKSLGSYRRIISEDDLTYRDILRRSISSRQQINKGEVITQDMIEFKRPGSGIQIDELPYILGRKTKNDIPINTIIAWEDLE